MSNVPQARQNLTRLARDLQLGRITKPQAAEAIRESMKLLTRECPMRKAAPRKRYVTRRLVTEICAYAREYPEAHLSDIAAWFDVNPGRVSEILNGKR